MSKLDWMKFFKEWKEEHKIDIFTVDGIVCPEKYEKILFVMKDVNNANNEGADSGYISGRKSCSQNE